MSYLIPGCPSAIYIFSFTVAAKTEKAAFKKALPIVKRCEQFAESIHILCTCDHLGIIDGKLTIRVVFNVKETQNSILMKVPAIFSFAATLELLLVNQYFFAEQSL